MIAKDAPVPGYMNGHTSKCHPYSSGVTIWLSEAALGVTPAAPGYATFDAWPMALDVRGRAPTPAGPIALELAMGDARSELTLRCPHGARPASVGVPFRGGGGGGGGCVVASA